MQGCVHPSHSPISLTLPLSSFGWLRNNSSSLPGRASVNSMVFDVCFSHSHSAPFLRPGVEPRSRHSSFRLTRCPHKRWAISTVWDNGCTYVMSATEAQSALSSERLGFRSRVCFQTFHLISFDRPKMNSLRSQYLFSVPKSARK